ncbi:MAG TPA: GntR family transcriptional regulator [Pirellulales bacterium]|jgi:DNA-binding GntR family transcriptional regulator|nr:GntR family transcriptional regulator [Pirellulales bacterium]
MPPVYHTIREQIVEQLREEVLSGEIAEGQSLREQHLATRFGVSRGPIRDALLQLTQEGLLIGQPNRGVKVGRGPSQSVQPLVVDLRRRIELFALERIFDSLVDCDRALLDEIVEKFRVACENGSLSALVRHDMALHRWIVERAGEPDLLALWLTTVMRMRLRYSRHESLMESYAEHRAIVDAIAARDKPAALAALQRNIQ